MQWIVCAARVLSSPAVLSLIFTDDKLDIAKCDRFRELSDDHRTILRQLSFIWYLPDDATTIEKFRDNIAAARDDLLEHTKRLIQPKLADRADVSDRSLRDHLPDLLELGLIGEAPAGYRFNLSFASDERTSDRYPTYVVGPLRPDIHKAAKALRVGDQHHFGTPVADDEFRSGITSDTWCADLRDLNDADPWIRDVLPLVEPQLSRCVPGKLRLRPADRQWRHH